MKSILKLSAVLFSASILFSCTNSSSTSKEVVLKNLEDSAMYGMGVGMAQDFGDSINIDAIIAGFKEGQDTETMRIKMNELDIVMKKFQMQQMYKTYPAIQEGQKFMLKKSTEAGVIQGPYGMLIKPIKEGTGKAPTKPTDIVTVNYKGSTVSGQTFDSSYDRGEPYTTPLTDVIQGWGIGLSQMKEGGKAELYIPANLAYRDQAKGEFIRPYETLIFEIELIKVEEGK